MFFPADTIHSSLLPEKVDNKIKNNVHTETSGSKDPYTTAAEQKKQSSHTLPDMFPDKNVGTEGKKGCERQTENTKEDTRDKSAGQKRKELDENAKTVQQNKRKRYDKV